MSDENNKYDVFISYKKSTGESYAENLKDALEKGNHRAFLASDDIIAGEDFKNKIFTALKECKYFVVIITSLAPQSEWVKKECEKALELNKRIIPCRYKDIEIEDTEKIGVKQIQQIEFEDKYELANKVIVEIQKIEKSEKEGISISEDPEEFLRRGNLWMNLKEYDEAEKEYREAIRINPNFAGAHNNLGNLLANLQQYDEAEKEYREAIRINPNYALAHNNLGVLLMNLQRYDEAEKEYREAIRINPNYAEAHNNLGILLADLKRHDEAEKEYREAIRINPNYAEAHGNLGNLLKNLKRYDEAKKEILKARELFEKQGKIEDVKICDKILKKMKF